MSDLRNRLIEALMKDGHSLRFGPDGYELDRTLASVRAYAAEELRLVARRQEADDAYCGCYLSARAYADELESG